ncbi:ribonuclease J [Chromohalobacter israelensis]|uniref:ribonuclease J n=1 Tax=Chromohalobacter israelensis TaxID=141390 RepID=UPI001CC8224B|nr:ribonuclease J [Chromohalobacter salexigens]MBZ5874807.1 ribonuclease J [Chromohalobacter salexigens]
MSQPRIQVRARRKPPLHMLPLGGCGEIGMNFTLYGHQDHWIVVDCGMMIRQDLPQAPLQVPNVDMLASQNIVPRAIVVTHGHEDHIGAIAWLWPRWQCPVHATPLAAGLLRLRFAEQQLPTSAIQVITPGDAMESGPFDIRFLPLPHSIPESCALLLTTPQHRILHTGDWKLDPEPLIGKPASPQRFQALAPVDLVVGDSTNAPVPGHSRSEGEVARALETTIGACPGRVIVSCFASNLARILALGRAAHACGRRVSLMGRSMERMVGVARGLGYLEDFPPLVPVRDLGYLPPEEVLVIATGSQGEPRAALSRLAQGRHADFELHPGDSVIFSAKAIPGNELLIERLQAGLKRAKVTIFDERSHPELHASGHPAQAELRRFYEWVKPRRLLPVHGEHQHQQAHRALAESLGIEVPWIPRNGDMLRLDAEGLHCESRHSLAPHIVTQNRIHPLEGLRAPDASSMHRRSEILSLTLPVVRQSTGWVRIGRLLWDTSHDLPLDDVALADWVDEQLAGHDADTIVTLRQRLHGPLMHWLGDHLRHLPDVHLHIMAAEGDTVYET